MAGAAAVEPDPVYSTYFGGSDFDTATAIAIGPAAGVFLAGFTQSADFPDEGAQGVGAGDMFVARLHEGGTGVTYVNVFSDTNDAPAALHPLPDGDVLVVGSTYAENFPTTAGAVQETHGGGAQDAFVMRLQAGGSIDWATYLGGSGEERAVGVDIASNGDVFVAGLTSSCDFPYTWSGDRHADPGCGEYVNDVFVVRLSADGTTVRGGALAGGDGDERPQDMQLGPGDDPIVVGYTYSTDLATSGAFDAEVSGGRDGFALRIDDELDHVEWATYLGGTNDDRVNALAVEPDGDVLLTGRTRSVDYPTTEGAHRESHSHEAACTENKYDSACVEGFVTEVAAHGGALKFSTYFGGDGFDIGRGIGIDDEGRPFVAGSTSSSDFAGPRAGGVDGFYLVMSNDGNHVLAQRGLGTQHTDHMLDIWMRKDKAWLTGTVAGEDYPTTSDAFDSTYNGDRDIAITVFEASDIGSPPAPDATFDHRGGNEWWVQVDVDPHPERVQARDSGGAWHELEFKWWGEWAGSFHIEPGHDVQFRAMYDGQWVESCWYAHPEGALATCSGGDDGDSGSDGETEADIFSFHHEGGNEWWVEARIDPMPDEVQARDTGGTWRTLTFRDWGEWAGSFHIEPGHEVQFRARYSGGTWDESCWHTHPGGTATTCEGATDDTDGGDATAFDATFRNARGNEWWIETDVDANEPLSAVEARINGGDWKPLQKTDWGSWAASHHAPEGSTVEFRATSEDGDTDASGTYPWPP